MIIRRMRAGRIDKTVRSLPIEDWIYPLNQGILPLCPEELTDRQDIRNKVII